MNEPLIFTVSNFVAYLNQTLEAAYPFVTIEGELSNMRVSRGKWLYFDLKDELASMKFFGTVYALPGPLEDGMVVRVSGNPRLHPQFGFSVNVQSIMPVGEGTLRRAADLLAAKLQAEGLFAPERKRRVPYPPRRVALLTAGNSAAYADFIKIVSARWQGITIDHYDVQVQGEAAPAQIVSAIATANSQADVPDVLVLTRGGGSADDLAAFNDERVVRAVAGSRVPTLVAIGHEIDESLSELAADKRASTPSNAAELLTPDRAAVAVALRETRGLLGGLLKDLVRGRKAWLKHQREQLARELRAAFDSARHNLDLSRRLLQAYDPQAPLQRGYALVQTGDKIIRRIGELQAGQAVQLRLSDGSARATIEQIEG